MDFITQIFSDHIIYALGWTVVHSLWQGTLLAIIVALAMMALENRSARLRYEVACGGLFMMLLSGLATFILYLETGDVTEEFIVALTSNGSASTLSLRTEEVGWVQGILQSGADYFNQNITLITSIWLIGFLFFVVKMIGGLLYLRQLRQEQVFPVDTYWQDKLKALSSQLPLERTVQLMESGLVKVPILLGHLKPLILVPLGTINMLSEEEVEAILAHELAHILRNDFLINLFFSFIEILFYYHPGVWLMAATIRTERENCCDDLALRLCRNPVAYARALFKLEEAHRTTTIPGFALAFSGKKHHLLDRIKRILNQPQNKYNVMEKLTATTFLLLTIAFLSIGAATPFDNANNKRLVIESVNTLESPLLLIEEVPTCLPAPAQLRVHPVFKNNIQQDTFPTKRRDKQKMVKTENGKSVEITTEDGMLTEFKIDGEVVPPSDYGQYENMIGNLMVEFENIPEPPAPPAPPNFNVPPAPPAQFDSETTTKGKVHISSEDFYMNIDEEEENLVIKFTDDDGEQKEISISEDGVYINGQIIINEDQININLNDDHGNSDIIINEDQLYINGQLLDEEEKREIRQAQKELQRQKKEELKAHKRALREQQRAMEQQQRELERAQREIEREHERIEREVERAEREIEREIERANREIERENERINRENERIEQENDNLTETLIDEMLNDGLISNPDKFKFVLTSKELKINRKKQPQDIHEKYKRIYEASVGHSLSRKSKVTIQRS